MDLAAWLAHLESRNAQAPIALGLDRVRAVARRLALDMPTFPIISVGGTNGKGSVCAYLAAMLSASGLRVACYTSPHLLRYNERVQIEGIEASDADLCAAFEAIEAARQGEVLTYFEQGTLAAMYLFNAAKVDVAVLEIGLGGRLDAVNLWDADCAIVTSVDLDHQQFLGDTREAIGFEKAGIFRHQRPAICGDLDPPESLQHRATELGTQLLRLGREIKVQDNGATWSVHVGEATYPALPRPLMAGEHQLHNAACAIAALHCLQVLLPVSRQAMRSGLLAARQPGRFQFIGERPLKIVDVAHNPHAARALAVNLARLRAERAPAFASGGKPPRTVAVLGMLSDKDVLGVVEPLLPYFQHWHCAGLDGPRGLSGAALGQQLAATGAEFTVHERVADAWQAACAEVEPADTICAFGSFHTVADVLSRHTLG